MEYKPTKIKDALAYMLERDAARHEVSQLTDEVSRLRDSIDSGAAAKLAEQCDTWQRRAERAEAERNKLKADLEETVVDIMAVLAGREPETWAWPLHGLRDALDAARQRAEKAEDEAASLAASFVVDHTKKYAPDYSYTVRYPSPPRSGFSTHTEAVAAVRALAGLAAPKETAK